MNVMSGLKWAKMEKKGVLDILTETQLHKIVARMTKPGSQIISYDLKPASEDGIAGFLGDHFRMTLRVKESNVVRKINLFVKSVPTENKPKADFIHQNQFFKKEAFVLQLLEDIQDVDNLKPWCTKAVIHDEKVIVMPDLSILGYKTHPIDTCLDRDHVFVVVSSLARFHAAFANYFTKRNQSYSDFLDEHDFINEEPFSDSTWLTEAAKVTYKFLKEFSSKAIHYPADLEDKLCQLYIRGYDSLKDNEDTLNLVIHKDLWVNNILFQYKDDVPINAVLVDFQLCRYAPPAFDLMSFLYLNTSRKFRDCYENEIVQHYFAVFSENLDNTTKRRLQSLNYDFESFFTWCEKARLYGFVQANVTLPCVTMDPDMAKTTFDNPETFMEHVAVGDKSKPILEHSRVNFQYRCRQLEIGEELVEKYVLKI